MNELCKWWVNLHGYGRVRAALDNLPSIVTSPFSINCIEDLAGVTLLFLIRTRIVYSFVMQMGRMTSSIEFYNKSL